MFRHYLLIVRNLTGTFSIGDHPKVRHVADGRCALPAVAGEGARARAWEWVFEWVSVGATRSE